MTSAAHLVALALALFCCLGAASASINPNSDLRVIPLVIEEPFSALFSFLALVITAILYQRYRSVTASYPHYRRSLIYVLWQCQFWATMWSGFWSTAFHAHENKLTEALDYYSAAIIWVVFLYVLLVRLLNPKNVGAMILLALPLAARYGYYLYYMHFVRFDYQWQVIFCAQLVVIHGVIISIWGLKKILVEKKLYPIYAIAMHLSIIACCPLEIFDFLPLFGHLDGHSLWHLSICFIMYLWFSFVIRDAEENCKSRKFTI
eukprot:TRINITY_DN9598_c0_g1_i1.p1 TRINITY_DN9598_c0_g1~~TRINITY_DN9598_c0_g1_i1.p1  ORF type:complete len:261 (+),score=95.54 TRINITY_DN9598_c0_g1_i1:1-783(+)